MILQRNLKSKRLLYFLLFIAVTASGYTQESVNRESLKQEIRSGITDEGVFKRQLFEEAMTGRSMTEVEGFTDELVDLYITEHLKKGGEPVQAFHDFIFTFYPKQKLAVILNNLARFGVFNAFSEALLTHLEKELGSFEDNSTRRSPEKSADEKASLLRDLRFAVHTYKGLRLYKTKQEKTAEEWEDIFGNLMKAWEARPLRIDAEIFVESAKNAKQKRALFELSAYFYYDRDEESFLRQAGLFFRHLFTPDKAGGFRKEMQLVRRKLRKDILLAVERETPEQMPAFTPATFFSLPAGETVIFDFASPESPAYGKPLVLSFFSTKCNHCLRELRALGRIRRELQTSMQPAADFNEPLFAAVNTNLPSIKKMKEEMPRYIEENGIEIPIYSNLPDGNSLILRYGIANVPLMLLFDKTGTPLARVRFNHMGHVKLKLQWILEEYLHVDF